MHYCRSSVPHKKILSLLLVLSLVLPVAAWAATGNPNAKPGASIPDYSFTVTYNVEVPMRDGVITRADLYLPDGAGPWPTIMVSTPYNKSNLYVPVEKWASNGYAVVFRDVRGIHASDGTFAIPSALEIDDQYDAMDWIIAQPWSNGKIGISGPSQLGQTSLFGAISGHPNLVCAVPVITAENVWRDGWYYRGGALEHAFLSSWNVNQFAHYVAPRLLEGTELETFMDTMALYNIDRLPYEEVLPLVDFEPSAVSEDFNLYKLWASHPILDEYWLLNSPSVYIAGIQVPVMHVVGWYDIFQNGGFQAYYNAKNNAYTKLARDNQYLVIGPWGHAGSQGNHNLTYNDPSMVFFDYWLKDLQNPDFDPEMHVIYSTLLGEEIKWSSAEDWPLSTMQETAYYLNAGKSGTVNSLNDGTLSADLPAPGTSPLTYVYDPMQPTPTRGGNTLNIFAYGPDGSPYGGIVEQTPVDEKSLTFTTAPLTADLEIAGKVLAILYASSDAVDTDFVVRLNDVAPDGTSTNVVDGILRARYRNSPMNPTLLEPGEICELEVDLWSTSWIFKEGHCLRVTVNSSSFPRWSRNMNVAEFPEQATEWKVANNTIYLDPEHPSHIILPVVTK